MVDYPNNPPAGVSFTSDPNLTRYAATPAAAGYNYAAGLTQANAAAQAAAQGGGSSSTAPISTPATPAPGTVPASGARAPIASGGTTLGAGGATGGAAGGGENVAVPLPPGLNDIAAAASSVKDPFGTTSTTKDQSRVPTTPTARSTTASPVTSASHIADVQAIFNGEVPFHALPDSFKQGVAAAFGPQAPQLYDNFRATTVASTAGVPVPVAAQHIAAADRAGTPLTPQSVRDAWARSQEAFRTDLPAVRSNIAAATGPAAFTRNPNTLGATREGFTGAGPAIAPEDRLTRAGLTATDAFGQAQAEGPGVVGRGVPSQVPPEARNRFDTEAAAPPPAGPLVLRTLPPAPGEVTTMTPRVAGVPDPRLRPGIDAQQPIGPGSSIQVKPGDNLWTIAARVTGNREGALAYAKQIMQLNGITRPRALQPGEVIRLPGGMAPGVIPNPPTRPAPPAPPAPPAASAPPARPPMGAPPPDLQFGGGGGAPGSAGSISARPPDVIDDLTSQAGRYATQMLNSGDIGGGFDYPAQPQISRGPDVTFGAGGGGDYRGRGPFGGRPSDPSVAADGYDTMRGPDVVFRPGGGFSAPARAPAPIRDPVSMGLIDPRYQTTVLQERPYEKALQDATDRAAARAGGTLRGGGGTTNFRGGLGGDRLAPRGKAEPPLGWPNQLGPGSRIPQDWFWNEDFLDRTPREMAPPRARVGSDLNRNDYAKTLQQLAAMGANDNAGKWRMTRDVMPYSVRRMPMAIPLSTNIPGGRPYLPPGVIMPDNSNVQGQGRGMPAWLDRFWNWF